jgi:hypothetical protein
MLDFREITLGDRIYIENITRGYPTYSDFNFVSIWCWSMNRRCFYTFTIGAYQGFILQLPHYLDATKVITTFIIAREAPRDVLAKFIDELLYTLDIEHLNMLPAEIALACKEDYSVSLDTDNLDYILSTTSIVELKGGLFERKRNLIRDFDKNFRGRYNFEWTHELAEIKDDILFFASNDRSDNGEIEHAALQRFFLTPNVWEHIYAGVVKIDGKIEAYTLIERNGASISIGHFMKANHAVSKGLNTKLIHSVCTKLAEDGIIFLNIEQDLGLQSLRDMKLSWRPSELLHKYILTQ